jgi:NADH-quinone oxidoreductase subunit E
LNAYLAPRRRVRGAKGHMAKLSPETTRKIEGLKDRFPHRRSAVIPALHFAQADTGCLEDDTLAEIARILDLPLNMTSEVVGFYTMFDRTAPGKYKLEVCRNLSCALMGANKVVGHLEEKLGIKSGETTSDGKFTLLEAECLGACGYAPMMMVGPYFYEFLDREKVDAIVGALLEDKEPPVAPAGYHEADGEKPVRGAETAVPTASEAIMSVHPGGGNDGGGE